ARPMATRLAHHPVHSCPVRTADYSGWLLYFRRIALRQPDEPPVFLCRYCEHNSRTAHAQGGGRADLVIFRRFRAGVWRRICRRPFRRKPSLFRDSALAVGDPRSLTAATGPVWRQHPAHHYYFYAVIREPELQHSRDALGHVSAG